jgi:hypothetical protein
MKYLRWDYIDMPKELRMWLYRYVEGTITNGIRSSGILHGEAGNCYFHGNYLLEN